MRTPNAIVRERLLQALRATPRRGSTELAKQLGVTPQSIRRILGELPERSVLSAGQTRRARYALRRTLRSTMEDLPLYAVDAAGQAQLLASLALVQPEGTLLPLSGTSWPVPIESRDGWWDGLPYSPHWPLIHMTPDEAVRAAEALNAKALLPGHVGKFRLARHPWDEPFDRLAALSEGKSYRLVTPMIGEPVMLGDGQQHLSRWWQAMR